MLRSITLKQFNEWMVFAELEPFDETRADVRASSIRATIAEVRRDPKRRAQPFTFADFQFPFGDAELLEKQAPAASVKKVQSWQEQRLYARMFAAEANALANRRKKRG